MEDHIKKAEEKLFELKKQKEEYDKRLLNLEIVIGFMSSVNFLILIYVASYIEMPILIRIGLIALGIFEFVVGTYYALKIEQVAGYYECQECHHKYIPKYSNMLWAMHIGRTRYMKCPKCGKKSWQKKVINSD